MGLYSRRMRAWSVSNSASVDSVSRHLVSALRRRTPRPEQGTSSSTRSAWLVHFARVSGEMGCVSQIRTPLRRARVSNSESLLACTSMATSRPWLRMSAARCSVLPPAPAQASTTHCPGEIFRNGAICCEPASWISHHPVRKVADCCNGRRTFRRRASGAPSTGSVSMPSSSKRAAVCGSPALRRFTLRKTSAGAFKFLAIAGQASP